MCSYKNNEFLYWDPSSIFQGGFNKKLNLWSEHIAPIPPSKRKRREKPSKAEWTSKTKYPIRPTFNSCRYKNNEMNHKSWQKNSCWKYLKRIKRPLRCYLQRDASNTWTKLQTAYQYNIGWRTIQRSCLPNDPKRAMASTSTSICYFTLVGISWSSCLADQKYSLGLACWIYIQTAEDQLLYLQDLLKCWNGQDNLEPPSPIIFIHMWNKTMCSHLLSLPMLFLLLAHQPCQCYLSGNLLLLIGWWTIPAKKKKHNTGSNESTIQLMCLKTNFSLSCQHVILMLRFPTWSQTFPNHEYW